MLKTYDKSNIKKLYDILKNRKENSLNEVAKTVSEIVDDVKNNGDKAVKAYIKKFDGIDIEPEDFLMSESEINEVYNKCDKEIVKIMEKAAENIEEYHKKQTQNTFILTKDGIVMGQRVLPLERVALYVPGGSASYPSTALMNAIPARIAGVKDIAILTPQKKDGINPRVIAAAKICGIKKVIKIGGAHGIAAAAYGTESIAKVDKIVGPGNVYVTAAKKLVYGVVDIDMIAGPSEILVIADKNADAKYIAADLMSQAEHDEMASAILVTDSRDLIEYVNREIERQIAYLSRKEIIEKSLVNYGAAVMCGSIDEAIEIANNIAPEHLELAVDNPFEKLDSVKNAGSVFLGNYTPEPVGDYFAGTNHVLPTNGTARFSSPLGVDSFMKKSSFVYYSKDKLLEQGGDIIKFAESEKLTAHANAVKVRLDK